MPCKKNFLAFLKNFITPKGKKPTLGHPGLRYAHKKLILASNIFLEVV